MPSSDIYGTKNATQSHTHILLIKARAISSACAGEMFSLLLRAPASVWMLLSGLSFFVPGLSSAVFKMSLFVLRPSAAVPWLLLFVFWLSVFDCVLADGVFPNAQVKEPPE